MSRCQEIMFEYAGIHFKCPLDDTYTLLGGESATGKTFYLDSLPRYVAYWKTHDDTKLKTVNDGKILCLNYTLTLEDVVATGRLSGIVKFLSESEDYVVCVDNADVLFPRYRDLLSAVKQSTQHRYLLAMRGDFGLYVPDSSRLILKPNSAANIVEFVSEGDL